MPCREIITISEVDFQEELEKIRNSETITAMMLAGWDAGRSIAIKLVERELSQRSDRRISWPQCPECKARIENKEKVSRKITGLIGTVSWKRKVGRCPNGCKIGQVAPLDRELGIKPSQKTSEDLQKAACALAVFVPYKIAAVLLFLLTKLDISAVSIWNWVQKFGSQEIEKLEDHLASGCMPDEEPMDREMASLPLIVGGDGVNVPFRPNNGSPAGKISWRQVKIGIVARLKHTTNKRGKNIVKIVRKRIVAVVGTSNEFGVRLWLEALRQRVTHSYPVVWISDGGPGFWNVFDEHFSHWAKGVLDFYHAAQNVWKAAKVWLDGRTKIARDWFSSVRHILRHGQPCEVISEINKPLLNDDLTADARKALENLLSYLTTHYQHINYNQLKQQQLPIGSGMIESACKWMIQQRFKGVGMRWSEDGFNSLLHLRLAWVNNRFDSLFSSIPPN